MPLQLHAITPNPAAAAAAAAAVSAVLYAEAFHVMLAP